MSKSNYVLIGSAALAIGFHGANLIRHELNKRESHIHPASTTQIHSSTLEDCVVNGVITGSNIPTLERERIRMRASGLDPIKVELAVNNGPNQGRYAMNFEGFTNPADGSPKSMEWKESYQNLFDTFSSNLTRGDSFPIPCGEFDILRSNPYPFPCITKLP